MLTSEQHRCSNEKRNFSAEFKSESAQLVVDQKTRWQMPPKLWMLAFPQWQDGQTTAWWASGQNTKSLSDNTKQIEIRNWGKSYNALKWRMKIKKGYRALDVRLPEQFSIIGNSERIILWSHSAMCSGFIAELQILEKPSWKTRRQTGCITSQVLELHGISHGSAGARSIAQWQPGEATRWDAGLLAGSWRAGAGQLSAADSPV